MADFDQDDNRGGGNGFVMGLIAGMVLGAGLGMLLAPKAGSDLRGAIGRQARDFGDKASKRYRRASESASGWAEKGREVVHQARNAMSRGAEETSSPYAGGTSGSFSNPGGGNSGVAPSSGSFGQS